MIQGLNLLSPEKQKTALKTKESLDHIFNEISEDLTGGASYAADQRTKEFLKRFVGPGISFDDVEAFHAAANSHKNGVFTYSGVFFIKTPLGNVLPVTEYTTYLEKCVLANEELVSGAIEQQNYFNSLSFFGLMKLAFKNLFKRSELDG